MYDPRSDYALNRRTRMEKKAKQTTSYKEIRIGNTIYRVTSVFSGEKDLGKTLEDLAVRRALAETAPWPSK